MKMRAHETVSTVLFTRFWNPHKFSCGSGSKGGKNQCCGAGAVADFFVGRRSRIFLGGSGCIF